MLQIDQLGIAFEAAGHTTLAVRNLSLRVDRGETFGLVGESGCGKSTTALAMLGYLPERARLLGGTVLLDGEDLLAAAPERLRALRGPGAAMVQQDPVGALNPVLTLGAQLLEVLRSHRSAPEEVMHAEVLQMLKRVALPDPASFMLRYPHQASGGQLQRIAIAMALLARPRLLVLDEPTTGLDVTIEAEVAQLVADLARDFDMAVVYISHNLGLIRQVCGRIAIMYAGEIVEQGSAARVFAEPAHPYTRALVACLPRIVAGRPLHRMATIPGRVPRLDREPAGCAFAPRCPFVQPAICVDAGPVALTPLAAESAARCVRAGNLPATVADNATATPTRPQQGLRLKVQSVWKRYGRGGGLLSRLQRSGGSTPPALSGVSMDVGAGEIVALVGESGSGKST
ncbi:MAG: oligopeptide/dipeptide ABC transporter ATP-binding protein, partial [Burkholderiaceae bacterium]